MSSRNSKRFAWALALILAAAVAAMAQPQSNPPAPATGNGAISGVVSNSATGAPLPRARVSVVILGNTGAQYFGAVTDAEGKYNIGSLPPGRFILNVDRVGFVAPAAGNRLADSQLRPDEKKENIKLTLTPTGGISGHVLNAEGGPVQGAVVSLDGALNVNPATTDEKGQYRISSVPPGRYRVVVNPAVMPFPPEIRTDGTREVHYARTYYPGALTGKAGQRVEAGAGAEVMGIDIRLVATPVVMVSGRVLDAPAGGRTQVHAVSSAATGGVQMTGNVKSDGSFEIWQLDPGQYTLAATNTPMGPGPQRGLQSAPVEVEVSGADIGQIELRMIQPFDVSFQLGFDDAKAREMPTMPAPTVAGQPPPAQAAPPRPMPRRMVLPPVGPTFAYLPESMYQPTEIGTSDSFTMVKLLPLRYRLMPMWGVYVKSVTIGNVETEGDIVDLRGGPAGAVTVKIGSVTAEVSGVVSDSSGPAAGVRIVMVSERSSPGNPILAVSAADGSYKFAAVPPGRYKLIAADNEIVMQFQMGRDIEEYADLAESIQVFAGDKVTKALKKQVAGGR